MDYVDLLLLGTPCDTFENTVAAYRALEELGASGKARAIGISNFDKPLINALMKEVTVTPAVNQCEFSIGFNYTAAAVLGVNRAGSCSTSTWTDASYRRHNACAAADHGESRGPSRKARCVFSPYALPWSAAALWLTARPFARECTS